MNFTQYRSLIRMTRAGMLSTASLSSSLIYQILGINNYQRDVSVNRKKMIAPGTSSLRFNSEIGSLELFCPIRPCS